MAGRARRRKYRRNGRGRLRAISALLATLIIVAVVLVAITVFFKVSNIVVEGNEKYAYDDIKNASGIQAGDNMYLMNTLAVTRRILDRLPYVRSVSLKRSPPETVVISVTETRAAAEIISGKYYWLIDTDGKLLERASEHADGMIAITGVALHTPTEGAQMALDGEEGDKKPLLLSLLQAILNNGIGGQVDSIDMEKIYDLSFRYEDRFTVKLGMNTDFDYLVRYFIALVDKLPADERGTVDMSVENYAYIIKE